MADITLGQFYNAIAQGAREATLVAPQENGFRYTDDVGRDPFEVV